VAFCEKEKGMTDERAQHDVHVSIGKGFIIIGGDRIEVSPDGKKVTAYTNDAIETKAASGAATPGISISADFNTVVLNGATIQRAADGHLVISTRGIVITKPTPANDFAPAKSALKPGDMMCDRTIYAGVSPDTGKAMYTTWTDAPLTMKWQQAMEYAATLYAHGHADWRAPTKGELNMLYNNRAKSGGFNETGSIPAGWYWSSSQDDDVAWEQHFSGGDQFDDPKDYASSLRCVRG
jgi:hypothetical protein